MIAPFVRDGTRGWSRCGVGIVFSEKREPLDNAAVTSFMQWRQSISLRCIDGLRVIRESTQSTTM